MTAPRTPLDTSAPRRPGRAVLLVIVAVFAGGIFLVAEATRDYRPAQPTTTTPSKSGPNP